MTPPDARFFRALRQLAGVPFEDEVLGGVIRLEERHAARDDRAAEDLDEYLEKMGTVIVNRLQRALVASPPARAAELLRALWVVLDHGGAHELTAQLGDVGRRVVAGDALQARRWLEERAPEVGRAVRRALR